MSLVLREVDKLLTKDEVPLSGMCTFTFITAYYGLGRHVIYAKDLVLTAKVGLKS